MSAARRVRRVGRNLLIALLAGAAIVAAIVVAYVAGRSTPSQQAGVSPGPPATQSGAAAPTSEPADAAPTGCLGGSARTDAMVLSAQRLASDTTYGAVEVATAFYRWTYRFPVPTSSEISGINPVFLPSAAAASETSLRTGYAENPNPSIGTVANGTSFYLNTVSGRWLVESGPAGATRVSIEASYVVGNAISPTKSASAAFNMKWVDGSWRVVGLAKADPSKLGSGGTTFTAGC